MKKLLVAAAVLLTGGVAGATASAITNDYIEDFEHPFVGLMVALDDDGEFLWRCSGSLIDSRTFVTAGHCTDDNAPNDEGGFDTVASARVYFQQDAGANYDPDTQYDPVSGYPDDCGVEPEYCRTAKVVADYGFDNFAGFPDTHDLGLVILDKPYRLDEYGQLPQAGAVDFLFNSRGQKDTTFLASGYGLSYSSPVGVMSFRSRLMGYGEFTNTVSANNGGYNLQTNGNGLGDGGTCSGDSGGPIFYPADSNTIVAVTSFGMNAYCRGVDFSYRIDRAETLAWIDSFR